MTCTIFCMLYLWTKKKKKHRNVPSKELQMNGSGSGIIYYIITYIIILLFILTVLYKMYLMMQYILKLCITVLKYLGHGSQHQIVFRIKIVSVGRIGKKFTQYNAVPVFQVIIPELNANKYVFSAIACWCTLTRKLTKCAFYNYTTHYTL